MTVLDYICVNCYAQGLSIYHLAMCSRVLYYVFILVDTETTFNETVIVRVHNTRVIDQCFCRVHLVQPTKIILLKLR